MVLTNTINSRLVVVSEDLHIIEYKDGIGDLICSPDLKGLVCFSTQGLDDSIVIWICSSNQFVIVDMRDKEYDIVESNIEGEIFAGLTADKGRRVILLHRGTDNSYRITYWQKMTLNHPSVWNRPIQNLWHECNCKITFSNGDDVNRCEYKR